MLTHQTCSSSLVGADHWFLVRCSCRLSLSGVQRLGESHLHGAHHLREGKRGRGGRRQQRRHLPSPVQHGALHTWRWNHSRTALIISTMSISASTKTTGQHLRFSCCAAAFTGQVVLACATFSLLLVLGTCSHTVQKLKLEDISAITVKTLKVIPDRIIDNYNKRQQPRFRSVWVCVIDAPSILKSVNTVK